MVIEQPGAGRIEISEPMGKMTNNQAEYRALLRGLKECKKRALEEAVFYLDSELVVRQVNGEYRVKQAGLVPLHRQVREALGEGRYEVRHVTREKNRRANALAQSAARYAEMELGKKGQGREKALAAEEWRRE